MPHPYSRQMPPITSLATLSRAPYDTAYTRKAGWVDVDVGPRRITFNEPAPMHPQVYYDPAEAAAPVPQRPLGVRLCDIHEHGTRWWQVIDACDEQPLAPFLNEKVTEVIIAIWAPDRTGGWKHYYRAIPIHRAYKTERTGGLALAVAVEFHQLCHDLMKYRLVALNHLFGNAYWAELGWA